MALNDQWHCHPWKLWPYLVPHNLSIGSIFQIDNQNLIHFSLSGNLSAFLSYWQRKSITDWKRHLNLLDLDKGCDLQSSRVTAMEMSLLKVIKVDTGIGGKGKGWQHKFITLNGMTHLLMLTSSHKWWQLKYFLHTMCLILIHVEINFPIVKKFYSSN